MVSNDQIRRKKFRTRPCSVITGISLKTMIGRNFIHVRGAPTKVTIANSGRIGPYL